MPDASPAKWHLAHTTWFWETFLLAPHLPGYARFDAMVSYQIDHNLTLQLNAYNLGDKVYYSGVRSPHYATIAAGRSAVASLKFTY